MTMLWVDKFEKVAIFVKRKKCPRFSCPGRRFPQWQSKVVHARTTPKRRDLALTLTWPRDTLGEGASGRVVATLRMSRSWASSSCSAAAEGTNGAQSRHGIEVR